MEFSNGREGICLCIDSNEQIVCAYARKHKVESRLAIEMNMHEQ